MAIIWQGCALNSSRSTKIKTANISSCWSGDISVKFCTSKNFPLYGTSSCVNWFLTQNQRKSLSLSVRFSSTAADLGDYENEEMDAEYFTEQHLLSPQVSLVSQSSSNCVNRIYLIRCRSYNILSKISDRKKWECPENFRELFIIKPKCPV